MLHDAALNIHVHVPGNETFIAELKFDAVHTLGAGAGN